MESAGMAFAIIFTIIVISFLLVFGYQQITQWLAFQEKAQVAKVLTEMEDTAQRNYDKAEDSTDRYKVKLPANAAICFVDPQHPEKRIYARERTAQNWDPRSMDAVKVMIRNNGYNIFYYAGGEASIEGYKIGFLAPASDGSNAGNFCARNGMTVIFTNKGLTVEVSPA